MDDLNIMFVFYLDQDSSLTETQYLISNVISASVANLSITNLKQNVTVTLETSTRNDSVSMKHFNT